VFDRRTASPTRARCAPDLNCPAVTVLSTDDPVRVYERFATLDAISGGRAEVIVGRASSTEPYPLFGYELSDYELLSDEKTELFAQLLTEKPINWPGTTRPPIDALSVYPRTESGLRAWIGVGGSTSSVLRAARYGMPLMIAIIGGTPARFRPLVDLYRAAVAEAGHSPLAVGFHSPGYLADTDEQAFNGFLVTNTTQRSDFRCRSVFFTIHDMFNPASSGAEPTDATDSFLDLRVQFGWPSLLIIAAARVSAPGCTEGVFACTQSWSATTAGPK
jgi:alkanesulfonate monooxygenase SsuD/methylene tetrahydromethanopterin reductase-like flavin-dependent oxidoreductase (luciferase family)